MHLMRIHVHAARCNFMQFGLPHMGSGFVNQGDLGFTFFPQLIPQARGQL